ncbi:hypothetical protein D3C84_974580 [compost metagenome]
MSYTVSCVLLIPEKHRRAINAVGEELGYGPNNLSVELRHTDGSTWWGAHAWCKPSFIEKIENRPADVWEKVLRVPGGAKAVDALIVFSVDGGSPSDTWPQCLSDKSLSIVQPDDEAIGRPSPQNPHGGKK